MLEPTTYEGYIICIYSYRTKKKEQFCTEAYLLMSGRFINYYSIMFEIFTATSCLVTTKGM